MITYLIDSNTVADFLSGQETALHQFINAITSGHTLGLCRPTYYEVLRGLLWRDALSKRSRFESSLGSFFSWIELENEDWTQAAQFYATTRSMGRQIASVDLLLAAIVYRLNATLVSSDKDFDVLPIKRITWRNI